MYVDKDKDGKYSIMDISEEEIRLFDAAFSSKGRDCLDEAHFFSCSRSASNEFFRMYVFYDAACREIRRNIKTEPQTVGNYKPENDTEL